MLDYLTGRVLGDLGVSIGTDNALVAFTQPVSDNAPALSDQHCKLLLNVETLARNYINSINSKQLPTVFPLEALEGFIAEVNFIGQYIAKASGAVQCLLYQTDYDYHHKRIKLGVLKKKFTAKQQKQLDLTTQLVSALKKQFVINSKPLSSLADPTTYLVTHVVFDLLQPLYNTSLLESHTGAVKREFEFNTKLNNAPDCVPFNRYTLQLFGDKNHQVLPISRRIRQQTIDICTTRKVFKAVMSEAAFATALTRYADDDLRQAIRKM